MSNEPLQSMFAAPYLLTASATLVVTDDNNPSGHTLSFVGASLWYRTFLAVQTGGAGTMDSPIELLRALQTTVNSGGSLWTFGLAANGVVSCRYAGTTTTGKVIFGTGSNALQAQLGYTTDITIAAGGSGTQAAAFLPNHCVFAYRRDDDTGWQERMPYGSFGRTGAGRSYGRTSGLGGMRRSMTLSAHPYDAATRTARGMNATPAFDDAANWGTPNAAPGVGPAGYSLRQFFQGVAAGAQRFGVALGNLQALIAGTDTFFFDCNLSPAASMGEGRTAPFRPVASVLYDRRNVELEWLAKSTR